MMAIDLPPAETLYGGPPDFVVPFDPRAETQARRKAGKALPAGHRLIALKRANKIVTIHGRPSIAKTTEWQAFRTWAIYHLRTRKAQLRWVRPDADVPLAIAAVYHPPDRVGMPDTDGMLATALDLLQDAGIIENDRQARRPDGSEIREPDPIRPRLVIWVRRLG